MNNFDYDNFDWNDYNAAVQDGAGVFDFGADFEDEYSEGLFPRFEGAPV